MARRVITTIVVILLIGRDALAQYCQYSQFAPGRNPVIYSGGGYIVNPQIYDIFVDIRNGSFWTTTGASQLSQITNWGLATNTYSFWNRVSEYGVAGSFNTPFTTSSYTVAWGDLESTFVGADSNTRQTIEYLLSQNLIPSSQNIIYMVYMSPSMIACNTSPPSGYCASRSYHSAYVSSSKGIDVTYAVLLPTTSGFRFDKSNGDIGSLSSHEIMEAVTDPYLQLWPNATAVSNASSHPGWEANPSSPYGCQGALGCEVGDLCGALDATNNYSVTGGMQGVTVSQVWSQKACRCVLKRDVKLDDFDGDGFEDTTLWQGRDYYISPPPAKFVYWPSFNGGIAAQYFGINSDIPVVADYDGDWKADLALWYYGSSPYFLVQNSSTGTNSVYYLGSSSDDPVPADFDGDGLADPATWTPSTGIWNVLRSNYGHAAHTQQWGGIVNGTSDWPCPADFDGDGIADYTVYRPNDPARGPGLGQFYVLFSSTNFTTYQTYAIGGSSDTPCPADVDGDGKADPMVYRPSDGNFYYLASNSNYLIQPGVYVGQYGSGLPMPRRWTFSNGALGSGINGWSNAVTFGVWDYWAAVWNWNLTPFNSPSGGNSFRTGDSNNLTASSYYD